MTKTFDLCLKCPRCWRPSLFMDFVPGFAELSADKLYTGHGATPEHGPRGELLCPLCGGYMTLDVRAVDTTDINVRDDLRKALPHAD